VTDPARLRNLESENSRLKKLLAEVHLDIDALEMVVRGEI
jgi:putative transposase